MKAFIGLMKIVSLGSTLMVPGYLMILLFAELATRVIYRFEPLLDSEEKTEQLVKDELKKLIIKETSHITVSVSFHQTKDEFGCLICVAWTPGNIKEFKMNLSDRKRSSLRHESYHIYRVIKLGAPHIPSYGLRYFLIEEPLAIAYALTKIDFAFAGRG